MLSRHWYQVPVIYITANGKQGEILHGDIDYIAQRITTLAKTEQLKKELAKTIFGVMGRPSDWLIASVPSYEEVTRKLGVTFKDISLDEVKKEYDRAVMVGKDLRLDTHFRPFHMSSNNLPQCYSIQCSFRLHTSSPVLSLVCNS